MLECLVLVYILILCNFNHVYTELVDERQVLIELYQSTSGVNWRNNKNWLSSSHIDEWFGVYTDHDERVSALYLPMNNLVGILPDCIKKLSRLRDLILADNHLSGYEILTNQ